MGCRRRFGKLIGGSTIHGVATAATTNQIRYSVRCCDCVSAFITDEVVYDANARYLQQLSEEIMRSPEFEPISVGLFFIPLSDLGRRFSWQFLGVAVGIATPSEIQVHRKKARLMTHWAAKCDVDLEVESG